VDYSLEKRLADPKDVSQRLGESLVECWLPYSSMCLALLGMHWADEGEHVRAAEMLGLALSHPAAPRGWLDRWPLLAQKQILLRAELGAEAYDAAWERGRSLDWDVAVEQVLAE
jgi:hypothetical protein